MQFQSNPFLDAIDFYVAAQELSKFALRQLKKSGDLLGVCLDPFVLSVPTNRQLKELNENALSDWLAWTLELALAQSTQPIALCVALFESRIQIGDNPGGAHRAVITREEWVAGGAPGQSGRTDILIEFPDAKKAWLIESKVSDAEHADLTPLVNYRNSIIQKLGYRDVEAILIVMGHNDQYYDNFWALSWEKLCVNIRRWIISNPNGSLDQALMLLFCAIVEQFLLRISKGSMRQVEYLTQIIGEA